MPPGRINLGVPFYTRGWREVTGGSNGLWGSAPSTDCSHGGHQWRARWWTQGDEPGTNQVWTNLGRC